MNKNDSVSGAGLLIAIGLAVGAFLLGNSVKGFVEAQRCVTVKGLSEREVKADVVSWPILTKCVSNNFIELSKQLDSNTKAIRKFLLENGLTDEEISVSPAEIIDMEAERYMSQKPTNRYNATSVVMVTSEKVDLVRSLLSRQTDLMKQGVLPAGGDYRYEVQYRYTHLNDIKTDMINEATRNARAAAEEFAKNSNSQLGKIKQANQGQISISDRDPNTQYIKVVRVVTSVVYLLKD